MEGEQRAYSLFRIFVHFSALKNFKVLCFQKTLIKLIDFLQHHSQRNFLQSKQKQVIVIDEG